MGKRKKSPCIDVCDFSGTKGWCLGCGPNQGGSPQLEDSQALQAKRLEKELSRRMEKLRLLDDS